MKYTKEIKIPIFYKVPEKPEEYEVNSYEKVVFTLTTMPDLYKDWFDSSIMNIRGIYSFGELKFRISSDIPLEEKIPFRNITMFEAAINYINRLSKDKIGYIVYGGNATLICPVYMREYKGVQ